MACNLLSMARQHTGPAEVAGGVQLPVELRPADWVVEEMAQTERPVHRKTALQIPVAVVGVLNI